MNALYHESSGPASILSLFVGKLVSESPWKFLSLTIRPGLRTLSSKLTPERGEQPLAARYSSPYHIHLPTNPRSNSTLESDTAKKDPKPGVLPLLERGHMCRDPPLLILAGSCQDKVVSGVEHGGVNPLSVTLPRHMTMMIGPQTTLERDRTLQARRW